MGAAPSNTYVTCQMTVCRRHIVGLIIMAMPHFTERIMTKQADSICTYMKGMHVSRHAIMCHGHVGPHSMTLPSPSCATPRRINTPRGGCTLTIIPNYDNLQARCPTLSLSQGHVSEVYSNEYRGEIVGPVPLHGPTAVGTTQPPPRTQAAWALVVVQQPHADCLGCRAQGPVTTTMYLQH